MGCWLILQLVFLLLHSPVQKCNSRCTLQASCIVLLNVCSEATYSLQCGIFGFDWTYSRSCYSRCVCGERQGQSYCFKLYVKKGLCMTVNQNRLFNQMPEKNQEAVLESFQLDVFFFSDGISNTSHILLMHSLSASMLPSFLCAYKHFFNMIWMYPLTIMLAEKSILQVSYIEKQFSWRHNCCDAPR